MEVIKTKLKDAFLIKPRVYEDERGYFFESFNKAVFKEKTGSLPDFVQENESYSKYGILRGLHFQTPPFAQAKLVRVVSGKVLDVIVDLRVNSDTYGMHQSFELSDINKHQLFVPRGFGHGFVVLSEDAIFSYKVDNMYSPENDSGIKFDDEQLNIDWKINHSDVKLSEKDQRLQGFENYKNAPNFK